MVVPLILYSWCVMTSSSVAADSTGGYDIGEATLYNKSGKVKSVEVEMLSCQKCRKLLREPVQLITCGCRYCRSCLNSIMAE